MNKHELIVAVAESTGLDKKECRKAVQGFIDVVAETLARSEKVKLTKFGKFSVSRRNERLQKNPQTGEKIMIPARNIVKFRPGAGLSGEVNC
jgi:DNA-binding protein HU-beta